MALASILILSDGIGQVFALECGCQCKPQKHKHAAPKSPTGMADDSARVKMEQVWSLIMNAHAACRCVCMCCVCECSHVRKHSDTSGMRG